MTDQPTDSGVGDEQYKEEAAAEAAQKAAADKEEKGTTTEGEGDSANAKEEETKAEDAEAGDGEGKGSEGEKGFEDTDTPQIPSRNASYILQRKARKEAKLKSKSQEAEEAEAGDDEEAEGDDAPDATEEESEVDRSVQKHLAPIIGTLKEQADEKELNELFETEPESKGYVKAIRAFMKHPAWSQIPPAAIFHHLHFQHAASAGAKKKAVADKEAKQMSTVGSTRRSTKTKTGNFPSADEIDAMTDAELDTLAHQVQTGKFAPKK